MLSDLSVSPGSTVDQLVLSGVGTHVGLQLPGKLLHHGHHPLRLSLPQGHHQLLLRGPEENKDQTIIGPEDSDTYNFTLCSLCLVEPLLLCVNCKLMIQCSSYTVLDVLHKPQLSHSWAALLGCVVNNTIQYNIQPLLGNIIHQSPLLALVTS